MNQEQNTNEATAPPVPKKLIDRPSDFRFHAAYLVYSEAWDRASSPEVKTKLNEIIEALSTDKIDYEVFYREVNQYRAGFSPEHFGGRTFIETARKRDWRKREERERRNKRHGR